MFIYLPRETTILKSYIMKTNQNELRAFYCRRLDLPVNGCGDLKTWQLKKMFEEKSEREEKEYFEQK